MFAEDIVECMQKLQTIKWERKKFVDNLIITI